ncbi:MAG TPA: ABC transporter substrate-binding protein [Stellaceae bacterium]|jgi:ABC-type nitrate/sulfonate/bicarbonate transport system substrate-binding protein|nr:ABC transporter substrate-binding protein [Stellaceae bacterium]
MAILAASGPTALADTDLRVGKVIAESFTFTPLDVGLAQGFFKQHGLTIQKFAFGGSAREQQALAANAIDIGLGSGAEFAMAVKGSPVTGVGEIADQPSLLSIVVPANAPFKNASDLKGRKIAVSTAGSLTQWLVRALSRRQGWGPLGIETPTLGPDATMIAAMRAGQVDGFVSDIATGYQLEVRGQGKVLLKFGDLVDHFVNSVIWARKDLVANNPQAVRDFLAAWYESVAWMRTHKDQTAAITRSVMNVDKDIAARTYDEVMPAMSTDGKFDPAGLDVLASSFPELHLLDRKVDLHAYIDEQYLPKR